MSSPSGTGDIICSRRVAIMAPALSGHIHLSGAHKGAPLLSLVIAIIIVMIIAAITIIIMVMRADLDRHHHHWDHKQAGRSKSGKLAGLSLPATGTLAPAGPSGPAEARNCRPVLEAPDRASNHSD